MEAACCCGSEPKAEQSVRRPAALVPVLARVCCSCRVLRLMPRFIPARLLLKKLTEGLEAGWGVGEASWGGHGRRRRCSRSQSASSGGQPCAHCVISVPLFEWHASGPKWITEPL